MSVSKFPLVLHILLSLGCVYVLNNDCSKLYGISKKKLPNNNARSSPCETNVSMMSTQFAIPLSVPARQLSTLFANGTVSSSSSSSSLLSDRASGT